MPTKKATKEEANLAVVAAFFDALLRKKDPTAVGSYLSEDFVSHNPDIPGKQGIVDFGIAQARDLPNANIVEMFLAFSHDDLVVRYYSFTDDPSKGIARYITDFFRIKGGLIVEYWDCIKELAH